MTLRTSRRDQSPDDEEQAAEDHHQGHDVGDALGGRLHQLIPHDSCHSTAWPITNSGVASTQMWKAYETSV